MNTYAKIEHGLYENPKIIGLSDKAFRTYLESILYSGNHLTDGFIDERIAKRMGWDDAADELTSNDQVNPSWQRVEGGWQIYGYCERQTSRADVEAMREQKSRAGKASVEAKRNRKLTEIQQSVEHTANKSSTKAQPDTDIDIDTDINKELKRGTRLQTMFVVTDEMAKWAKDKHPLVDIDTQTDAFIDYWTSQPGQKGVKSDWVATWRNWIRNSRPTLSPAKSDVDPNAWMIAEQIILP